MNIIPEVIIPLLPEVVKHAREHLLLSGILATRRDEVAAAAAALGWRVREEREKGEWWAGLLHYAP